MGIVIERAAGSLQVVDTTAHKALFRVEGLGTYLTLRSLLPRWPLRLHFRSGRGVTKVDILCGKIVTRVVQAGNSIGGAISQDGQLIAVSNYEPGGVKIFSAQDLSLIADIPATGIIDRDGKQKGSKTVGLVDAPGQRFAVSLYDSGEAWVIEMKNPTAPKIQRYTQIGALPYDALVTPDGRYYISGLFGQDGLSLLDLWHPETPPRIILQDTGVESRCFRSIKCHTLKAGQWPGIAPFCRPWAS